MNLRHHALALGGYLMLAFLTIYPLVFANGSLAAGYDYFHFHWNFWWTREALTTPGLDLYQSNYILYPFVGNFAYTTLSLFWFPLWAVLEPVTGTLTAMTLITWVAITLMGYLFYVYLRAEGVSPGLAFLAGTALQATPLVRYFYYNTHINLIGWFWLPVHLLLWRQVVSAINTGQIRRALAWGGVMTIGLWAMVLTDLQFPLMLALLIVPVGLRDLWRSPHRGQIIAVGSGIVAVALALLWIAGPLSYILQGPDGSFVPGVVEDRPGIPFPGGFLWTYDRWWHWDVPTLGGFVMIAVLASLVVGWRRDDLPRDRWLWFALMLPPMILAIGPDWQVFGLTIPMPYRVVFDLTDGNFRMPWRVGPVYVIAGLIFTAKTWTPILRGWTLPRRAGLMTAAALLLVATLRLYQPGPLQPIVAPYDFYAAMGAEDVAQDYVIVQAPSGVGTGELLVGNAEAIAFQYYGLAHGRRMVNGFLARAPLEHFFYLRTGDPLLSWIGQRIDLNPELVESQLRRIIPEWPLGYIVIHKDFVPSPNGESVREMIGYFNSLPDLLCPVFIEGQAIAYRTHWHPAGCPPRTPPEVEPGIYRVDIGGPADETYTGWGWYWREDFGGLTARWTGEPPTPATLYVDLPPGAYTLAFSAQSFQRAKTVTIRLDDTVVGAAALGPAALAEYTVDLPAALVGEGVHLSLTFETATTAAPGGRDLGLMIDWIEFRRMNP